MTTVRCTDCRRPLRVPPARDPETGEPLGPCCAARRGLGPAGRRWAVQPKRTTGPEQPSLLDHLNETTNNEGVMTMTKTQPPPDGRLDGPIHGWFGLSYSNYQVLHRTLMQSMPVEWQERMVACLEELHDAFTHVGQPDCYEVKPATERYYSDLTEADMQRLGITRAAMESEDADDWLYYDADGNEHDADDRVLVPHGDDPVPHYNRGRTYIEPRSGESR